MDTPKSTPAQEADAAAELVIRAPGDGLRHVIVPDEGLTLGSKPGCDVLLESVFVSRSHARIERDQSGDYFLVDTNSHNGVAVNGAKVRSGERAPIQSGDRIEIQPFTITFYDRKGGTQPLPVPRMPLTGLTVDLDSRRLFVDSQELPIKLGKLEFDLLGFLYAHRGHACTRRDIGALLWGGPENFDDHMLDAVVHRTKKKFDAAGVDLQVYLKAIPRVGYRLDSAPQEVTQA